MSHHKALSIAKQELKEKGMTLNHKDGEYRVNHRGGKEATAYYTNDMTDALLTGHHMSRAMDQLNKETERGEHKPSVGGYSDHKHGGES